MLPKWHEHKYWIQVLNVVSLAYSVKRKNVWLLWAQYPQFSITLSKFLNPSVARGEKGNHQKNKNKNLSPCLEFLEFSWFFKSSYRSGLVPVCSSNQYHMLNVKFYFEVQFYACMNLTHTLLAGKTLHPGKCGSKLQHTC